MGSTTSDLFIWLIAAVTIGFVLARPFNLPEWVSASVGALVLMITMLEPFNDAVKAFLSGFDVYFFLVGMMMLSELAREEGVFDWLAGVTTEKSRGSPIRLFIFIYTLGVVVTAFMSNDATAVVLTPAVYACVKRAKVDPKPYLFACALIANAASFLLPISNPANLVVFGKSLPPLSTWISQFALPSVVSILSTLILLVLLFRRRLKGESAESATNRNSLSKTGQVVLVSLALVVATLLISSFVHIDLGLPAFIASSLIVLVVSLVKKRMPNELLSSISWGVIPMVGGLFIVVDAVNRAQVLNLTRESFEHLSSLSPFVGKQTAAFGVGLISNVANNLPVGLTVGIAAQTSHISELIRKAVLIGVDLGPNLSVTGSLATLLWLIALRREGERVGFFEFLKVGLVVMPISLFLSVLVL